MTSEIKALIGISLSKFAILCKDHEIEWFQYAVITNTLGPSRLFGSRTAKSMDKL